MFQDEKRKMSIAMVGQYMHEMALAKMRGYNKLCDMEYFNIDNGPHFISILCDEGGMCMRTVTSLN